MSNLLYSTEYGKYFVNKCDKQIRRLKLKGKVQLILTSPPFPLNNKKQYGNLVGQEYLDWLAGLAPLFSELLTENGSIVMELGNAWEKGRPVQSLLHLKSLMSFVENPVANLRLCQEFICYNPARLPSPAQWVTINRIRTIDSFTHVWWMSNSDRFNPLILESIPLILLITQNFKKTTKIFFHPTSIWIVSSKVGLAFKTKPQAFVVQVLAPDGWR
jgi:site-specific DNA-methyltransferase (cytosine-N4-specific)